MAELRRIRESERTASSRNNSRGGQHSAGQHTRQEGEGVQSSHVDLDQAIDFQGQTLLHLAIDYECITSVVALLEVRTHACAFLC